MPLVLLTCDTCGDRVIIDAVSVADARRRAAAVEAWTYDDDRDTCPQHDERIDP